MLTEAGSPPELRSSCIRRTPPNFPFVPMGAGPLPHTDLWPGAGVLGGKDKQLVLAAPELWLCGLACPVSALTANHGRVHAMVLARLWPFYMQALLLPQAK